MTSRGESIVILASLSALLSLAAAMALSWQQIRTAEDATREQIVAVGSISNALLSPAVLRNDQAAVKRTLSAFDSVASIMSVTVYGLDGHAIASYAKDPSNIPFNDPTLLGKRRGMDNFSGISTSTDSHGGDFQRTVEVRKPILAGGRTIGSMTILASAPQIQITDKDLWIVLGLPFLLSVILFFYLIVAMRRMVKEPLSLIGRRIRDLEDSSATDWRIEGDGVPGEEELVTGVNRLLSRISERVGTLTEDNTRLKNEFVRQESETKPLIQALKEKAEALDEANDRINGSDRANSQLLANMSHEIRTPLNGVLGMAELLSASDLTDKQRRFATTIRRSAEDLLNIINDLLDFSRIEHGRLQLEYVDFDIREIVEDVAELLAEPAQKKGLELACHVPDDFSTRVHGDSGRLRQVLTNLITNAIKFTQDGEVLVSVRMLDESDHQNSAYYSFEISDTGIGIQPEVQAKIFDPFSQGDASSTRRFGGTGIGLAICKHLVELMDGDIKVHSTPGIGSRFEFRVRLNSAIAIGMPKRVYPEAVRGVRVLIVDDNETNRSILAYQLNAWNIDNDCVEDGPSALKTLKAAAEKEQPYDIAVLDMQMPDMDGLQLAEAIKKDPMVASVKLMMLTSAILDLDREHLEEIGILQFTSKPVRQSQLFNCLAGMIGVSLRQEWRSEILAKELDEEPPFEASILLAEDNPVNQEVARNMLELLGCQVSVVEDGKLALEACEESEFDVVFMDCQMPVMDGFEATAALRNFERESNVARHTIIALTANALTGDREHCLSAGMDDYLSKPVKKKELREALGRWLADLGKDEARDQTAELADSEVNRVNDGPEFGAHVDQETIEGLRQLQQPGKPDVLSQIIKVYLDKAPEQLTELREAVGAGDPDVLRFVAHALKSASANVGAAKLAELCKALEVMGREGSLDGAGDLVEQVEATFRLTRQELRPYCLERSA